jgi:hypothetical protein
MPLATCFATLLEKRRPLPADATVEAWRKALLVCGIVSSLLYGAMIGAIRFEGYSRISQRINIGVFLLWIAVLATGLLGGGAGRLRPPGETRWTT